MVAMNLTPDGPGDKGGGEPADTAGMSDHPGEGLSAEREAQVRSRLASGYYSSAAVLDRLARRLADVLRRPR